MIGPISDMQFDQLIGAGCVKKIIASWVGNVAAGLGHNYRRAAEARTYRTQSKSKSTPILPSAWRSRRRRSACPFCRRDRSRAAISPTDRISRGALSVHRRRTHRRARDSTRPDDPSRATGRLRRQRSCLGQFRRHARSGVRGEGHPDLRRDRRSRVILGDPNRTLIPGFTSPASSINPTVRIPRRPRLRRTRR